MIAVTGEDTMTMIIGGMSAGKAEVRLPIVLRVEREEHGRARTDTVLEIPVNAFYALCAFYAFNANNALCAFNALQSGVVVVAIGKAKG